MPEDTVALVQLSKEEKAALFAELASADDEYIQLIETLKAKHDAMRAQMKADLESTQSGELEAARVKRDAVSTKIYNLLGKGPFRITTPGTNLFEKEVSMVKIRSGEGYTARVKRQSVEEV